MGHVLRAVASQEHAQTNRSLQRACVGSINIWSWRHRYQLILSFCRTSCSGATRRRARHIWRLGSHCRRGRFLSSHVGVRRKPTICSTVIQCLLHDTFAVLFQAVCENQPGHPQSFLHCQGQPQRGCEDSRGVLRSDPRTRYVDGNAFMFRVEFNSHFHNPTKDHMLSLWAASKGIFL